MCGKQFQILKYSSNYKKPMLQILDSEPHKQPQEQSVPKYIMIRQPLDKCFNYQQWQQISQHNSDAFIALQIKIYDRLINCQELFACFFDIFYDNHVRLYHWYLLAREKHHIIKPYTFKRLLRRSKDQHRDVMKFMQVQQAREREREKQMRNKAKEQQILAEESSKLKRYKIDDLSNQIFNFMATKAKTASLLVWQKPWSFKKHVKQNYPESANNCGKWTAVPKHRATTNEQLKKADISIGHRHDFHQLYIQTFHACDGPRYIFYNYEKHMKGLSQKDKYNTFIRGPSKNKVMDIRLTQNTEEQPILKEIQSLDIGHLRCSYEFSSFGKAVDDSGKKKTSKVVFRRMKSKHVGKFIRK